MVANQNQFYVSPEDYLVGERESPIKHEQDLRKGTIYRVSLSYATANTPY
ncbi:hypothetical protein [Okeania sp. SIO3B5]|nr:hypothetical protein [Okeania sp. SIO3B5]